MSSARARRSKPAPLRRTPEEPGKLVPPPELSARPFEIDGDRYAILAFPLPEAELPAELSGAERAVVQAVLEGLSNAEIARLRCTSPHTVANQLRSVFSKLDVSSRFELTDRCARKGLRSR